MGGGRRAEQCKRQWHAGTVIGKLAIEGRLREDCKSASAAIGAAAAVCAMLCLLNAIPPRCSIGCARLQGRRRTHRQLLGARSSSAALQRTWVPSLEMSKHGSLQRVRRRQAALNRAAPSSAG